MLSSNISDAKKLQNYYLVLSLAFFLASYQLLSQQKIAAYSEKTELLIELLNWKNFETVELTRDQLFGGTNKGRRIADHLAGRPYLPSATQYEELGYAEETIKGGSVATLELRSHPRIQCEVLMIERDIESSYRAFAPTMSGPRVSLFDKTKVRFFDASDCVPGYQGELSGFIVHSNNKDAHFFVLPISWLDTLPGLLFPKNFAETPVFADESGQIESSKGIGIDLFPPTDHHVMTSSSALKNALARSLSSKTGGKYKGTDLRTAIDDLFIREADYASFGGINAPLYFVIHVAPLFLLFVLWQLHRAIKKTEVSKDVEYWVISDVSDLPGLLIASAYALLPYLFSVVMAVSFCSVFSISGVYLGFLVRFDEGLRLVIETAPPPGWITGTSVPSLILAFLWWLHIALAMRVSLSLLGLTLKFRQSDSAVRAGN